MIYDLHPFTRKKTYCIAKPYRMQGLPTEGDGQIYIYIHTYIKQLQEGQKIGHSLPNDCVT